MVERVRIGMHKLLCACLSEMLCHKLEIGD